MNDKEIGFLEAVFDLCASYSLILDDNSKRSFTKTNFTFKPIIRLSSDNKPVMEKVAVILNKRICYRKLKTKTCYEIIVTSGIGLEVLPKLSLSAKEDQRLLLIEAMKITTKRHTWFSDEDNNYEKLMGIRNTLRDLNNSWPIKGSKYLKEPDKNKHVAILEQKIQEIKSQ